MFEMTITALKATAKTLNKHVCVKSVWFFAVWIMCFLPAQPIRAQTPQDLQIRRLYFEKLGDRLYDTREIPNNLELAVYNYKEAIKLIPRQPGINWKISRCYWALANRAVDEEEKESFYKQGINYSKIAVENDHSNSNAHLWYSLTVGSQALESGIMNALYLRDPIKAALEKALALDPNNVNALMGLAGWYFYVPVLLGGDKSKTFGLIDKALKVDPNYTGIRIRKAEMLVAENRYREAVIVLQKLIRIDKPTLSGDGREDKAKAKEMLEWLKEKGYSI